MYVFLVFDLVFLACCYEDIRMLYIISQCPLLILFHLDGKSQSRGAPLPVPPFPPLLPFNFSPERAPHLPRLRLVSARRPLD